MGEDMIDAISTTDSPMGQIGVGGSFRGVQSAWLLCGIPMTPHPRRHRQVAKAQADLDDHVKQLAVEMDHSCEMAKQAASLRGHSPRFNEIFVKIMQQVMECGQFVKYYRSKPSFGMCSDESLVLALRPHPRICFSGVRAIENLVRGTQDQVNTYIANLKTLCGSLHGESSVSCLVTVCRVLDDVEKINETLENIRKFLRDMLYSSLNKHFT